MYIKNNAQTPDSVKGKQKAAKLDERAEDRTQNHFGAGIPETGFERVYTCCERNIITIRPRVHCMLLQGGRIFEYIISTQIVEEYQLLRVVGGLVGNYAAESGR